MGYGSTVKQTNLTFLSHTQHIINAVSHLKCACFLILSWHAFIHPLAMPSYLEGYEGIGKLESLVILKPLYLSSLLTELKAVLQRSPIRFRGNRGDLPTCTEDPSSGGDTQRSQEGEMKCFFKYSIDPMGSY